MLKTLTFVLLISSALAAPVLNKRSLNDDPCGMSKVTLKDESSQDNRIVGGSNAQKGQYPWMISLVYLGLYHICGATIIDDYWIMTAAHCFGSSTSPSYYTVRAGAYDFSQFDSNVKDYYPSKIILHEKWNSALIKNDVALIKLTQPINFTSQYVNRVCLPSVDPYTTDNMSAKIVGWGDTKNVTSTDLPSILQHADTTIQDSTGCSTYWNNLYTHASQVCAKSATTAVCSGDSGGPILVKDAKTGAYVQVGISSFVSSSGCLSPYPVVFTRVSYFYSWIVQTMAAN